MDKPTTFVVLFCGFSFLLIAVSVSADSTCPDPVDRTTVRDFQCVIRAQTGITGGSDNDIYIKLFDNYTRQTEWYWLKNQNHVDFLPNTNDSFTLIFSGIAPAIDYIEIKEYSDPSWWLICLEVFCLEVKIDLVFPRNGYIINRDQQLINYSQTLCLDRGTISNGTMTCSDDTKWGSVCNYKCDSVIFKMKGPECVYCRQNGTWSDPVNSTTCEEISCPPRNLTNGKVSCTNGLFFDSTCTYQCDDGYILKGATSATCLLTGDWSDDLPSCEAVMCPHQQLTNGSIQCTNGDTYASVCTYTCNTGFKLAGSNTATCQDNGNWNTKPPICTAVVCPHQELTNGLLQCTNGDKYASVCTYACNRGFALVGPNTTTCQDNGNWNNRPPICTDISFPPRNLTNGKVSCTYGLFFDSTCTYACDEGFALYGSTSATCLLTGDWSDDLPRCQAVMCPHQQLANGTVQCTNGDRYASVCKYTCNTGFVLVGSNTATCQDNGTWNPKPPICTEISCPPRNLTNGKVSCTNGLFFDSTCTYACDEDFALNGSTSATCLLTGDWSADLPRCQAVMCPHQQLTNGTVQCTNGDTFYSVCTYTCNRGFALVGSNTTTCQDNGNWNPKPPICTEISCPPRSLTNGKVSCTYGLFFDSTCTYACDEGFALNGSTSATCLLTGDWNADLPRCQAVMCPHQQLANGTVQCTNGDTFDSVCTYTCNTGFALVGSSTATCQDNGNWNPKPPICNVVHPDNHNEGLSKGAIAGIVVGTFVVVVVAVAVLCWCSRRKDRNRAILQYRYDQREQ